MIFKIAMGCLFLIFCALSNGCSFRSSEPANIYNNGYNDVAYGANNVSDINDVDFNHQSLVGYGGVNVYNFDGVGVN